jgi:hypothetical protein
VPQQTLVMLTANELRIGNLIFWNPKLSSPNTTLPAMQVEVCAILEDKIGYTSPGIEYRAEPFEDDLLQMETSYKSFEELEPILLTREILERCGFRQADNYAGRNIFLKDQVEFLEIEKNIIGHKVSLGSAADHQRIDLPYAFKFLHQLQNLFFALTGEELEISP